MSNGKQIARKRRDKTPVRCSFTLFVCSRYIRRSYILEQHGYKCIHESRVFLTWRTKHTSLHKWFRVHTKLYDPSLERHLYPMEGNGNRDRFTLPDQELPSGRTHTIIFTVNSLLSSLALIRHSSLSLSPYTCENAKCEHEF